jgi:hypothetical protein
MIDEKDVISQHIVSTPDVLGVNLALPDTASPCSISQSGMIGWE